MASELMGETFAQEFDALSGWQRQFIKKLVATGSWEKAATEISVPQMNQSSAPVTAKVALEAVGITALDLATRLKECLEAMSPIRCRRTGEILDEVPNHLVRLRALELSYGIIRAAEARPPLDVDKESTLMELFSNE